MKPSEESPRRSGSGSIGSAEFQLSSRQIIFLISALALTGCVTSPERQLSPNFEELRGTWEIVQFDMRRGSITPEQPELMKYTVGFRDDFNIGGVFFGPQVIYRAGCNSDVFRIALEGERLLELPDPELPDGYDVVNTGVGCSNQKQRQLRELNALMRGKPTIELRRNGQLTIRGDRRRLELQRKEVAP